MPATDEATLDSGATEETQTQEQTAGETAQATTEETATAESGAKDAEPGTATDQQEAGDDYAEMLRNLREQNARLKREKAELKSQVETRPEQEPTPEREPEPTGDYKDAGQLHPLLKGCNYDPSDKAEAVEIEPDRWVSEREALAIARTEAREQAENESAVARDRAAVIEPIRAGIAKEIGRYELPKEDEPDLQLFVETKVAQYLDSKGIDLSDPRNLPKGWEEDAIAAVQDGMKKATRLFGLVAAAQARVNEQAKSKQGLKPGGGVAVPADKPLHEMTDKEREQWAIRAAKAAEDMRISG